jgi:MFS family permease
VAGLAGDVRAGFVLASLLLLAGAVVAAWVFPSARPEAPAAWNDYHSPVRPGDLQRLVAGNRVDPLLAALYVVAFVQMLGAGLLVPIAAIYARQVVGLSEHAIGIVFLVLVLAVAAATIPAGRAADRLGKARMVLLGMVLGTAGMWAMPLATRLWELAGAAVLLGASYAASAPAWLALVSELAPPDRLGLAVGASETAQALGLVIGPLLGGLLWDVAGPQAPFVASASVLTVGTLIAMAAVRRHEVLVQQASDR